MKHNLLQMAFDRLTVVGEAPNDTCGARWLCECVCGTRKIVAARSLKSGDVKSCGCLQRDTAAIIAREANVRRTKHGHARGTPEYRAWLSMRARCMSPRDPSYHRYGAIGITVCDRWLHSFETFLADMGDRSQGRTIDRIDGTKGYFPENCRWATPTEQARNRKNNKRVIFRGREMTMAEAIELSGLNKATVWFRVYRGYSVEQALTLPANAIKTKSDRRITPLGRRVVETLKGS